jgi:hypothetical protein
MIEEQLARGERAEKQVQAMIASERSLLIEIERLRDIKAELLEAVDQNATAAVVLQRTNAELLAALEEAVEVLEEIGGWGEQPSTLTRARAAIAKAKG